MLLNSLTTEELKEILVSDAKMMRAALEKGKIQPANDFSPAQSVVMEQEYAYLILCLEKGGSSYQAVFRFSGVNAKLKARFAGRRLLKLAGICKQDNS